MTYAGQFGYTFADRRRDMPARPVHTVVAAPADPNDIAVSVADVKEHLGYGDETDATRDAELKAFIKAAQAAIEHHCELTLLTTTFRADYESFEDRWSDVDLATIPLLKRPYDSVTSIQYVANDDGEITTLDTSKYHVVGEHQMLARVYLGEGLAWPDTANRKDAVRITYDAGWAVADVPEDIKLVIKMMVAKFDANRGDCDDGGGEQAVYAMKNSKDPIAILLAPYKKARVVFV